MKVYGLPEGQGLDRRVDIWPDMGQANQPGDPGPDPRAVHKPS